MQANSKKNNPNKQLKEDITNDDEDIEGSGFEESRDDLESSGSGYGPDDEDANHGSGVLASKWLERLTGEWLLELASNLK